MTEQEIINYFQTHGLEIQEYNIDENGNITLRANGNGERNGPQELKDTFNIDPRSGQWSVRIGYNGSPRSNGHKYSYPYGHISLGTKIQQGAFSYRYYGTDQGPLPPTQAHPNNPTDHSRGRGIPGDFLRIDTMNSIICNIPVTKYHFTDNNNTLGYGASLEDGRNIRYDHDATIRNVTYRFSLNIGIVLIHKSFTGAEGIDHPILQIILPYYAGERDINTTQGSFIS